MMKLLIGAKKILVAEKAIQIYGRRAGARELVLEWVLRDLDDRKLSVVKVTSLSSRDDITELCSPNRILVLYGQDNYSAELLQELKQKCAGIIFCANDRVDGVCSDKDVIINAKYVNKENSAAIIVHPDWDKCFVIGEDDAKKRNFKKGNPNT